MKCNACGIELGDLYASFRIEQQKSANGIYSITSEYKVCTHCAKPLITKILDHTYGARNVQTATTSSQGSELQDKQSSLPDGN